MITITHTGDCYTLKAGSLELCYIKGDIDEAKRLIEALIEIIAFDNDEKQLKVVVKSK